MCAWWPWPLRHGPGSGQGTPLGHGQLCEVLSKPSLVVRSYIYGSHRFILQSLPKPTVGQQNFRKSGDVGHDCRPTSASILAEYLVEAPKLKVSLTDPQIFMGFAIGKASGWSPDDRPTFWRNLHHNIGRRSPDHRASIGRRSPDSRSMRFYQRTVGRQTPLSAVIRPIVAWQSADHKMWFVLYFL